MPRILIDMQGLLLHAIVHSAGVQDRDGGIWLLATLFGQFPLLAKLVGPISAYAGPIVDTALDKVLPNLQIEIVSAPSCQRVLAITQTLDCRTYAFLGEPSPPTDQRLENLQSQRSR